MVYELLAYNTDCRYSDIRYRSYTTSFKKAQLFEKIPKIQFTDSGHGVVFIYRIKLDGIPRRPCVSTLRDYVNMHMSKVNIVLREL